MISLGDTSWQPRLRVLYAMEYLYKKHPTGKERSLSELRRAFYHFYGVLMGYMGMDQYLLIPFLGEWTSIYQLFWCSPGVQGFDTLPYGVLMGYMMVIQWHLMGFNGIYDDIWWQWRIPSGYVKIAIENGHRNSGFTVLKNGGSFHSYVKLPEGNPLITFRIIDDNSSSI